MCVVAVVVSLLLVSPVCPRNMVREAFKIENSAKRDTRPLKDCDLKHKCSLGGIPKDHLVEKNLSV